MHWCVCVCVRACGATRAAPSPPTPTGPLGSRLTPLAALPVLLAAALRTSPAAGAGSAGGTAPGLPPGAAPWDGIVGFLRFVGTLQERRTEPDCRYEEQSDGRPLRKIVYAVEEQVSVAGEPSGGSDNASVVVYDSLRDAATPPPRPADGQSVYVEDVSRSKRSPSGDAESGTAVEVQSGRQSVAPRPYLIGRKLWYVPLWFGLYLILYITALTVKSVARHRIKYPTLVSEDDLAKRRNGATRRVGSAITNTERRYQQRWNM
ncbi:hypothetical protein ONE63_000897 [Megalurothrips usitatus]|uniref:Uncharacterized protein n=1 Tax=Megalurothrips usitatus TaxID=439358 RepID=A0AAV7Y3T0_9NEOP|nr:hypothetical protein ONE63_000897 [Megalurothrips usitatus]